MSNEYAVNQADLVSVADAIRAKGETAEALSFPDGFVSAIGAIQTGAKLNFQVVGGTTEPENPAENTIWVSTDQAITSWVFSHNQPDSPSEGMVWIVNGASSISEFDAVSDVSLRVQVAGVKQYVGGAWVDKTAKVYQNGAWHGTTLYLYNNGYDNTSVTGGWVTMTGLSNYWTGGSKVVKGEDYFECTADKTFAISYLVTSAPIDLTPFNAICINVLSATATGGVNTHRRIVIAEGNDYNKIHSNSVAEIDFQVGTTGMVSLDVSQFTGEYFIGVGAEYESGTLGSLKVSEVWLQ